MTIGRHDKSIEQADIWTRLAADRDVSAMTQDEANRVLTSARLAMVFAHKRLDAVVPGDWDCTFELLDGPASLDGNAPQPTFKCRVQVLGVIREAVGTGRTYVAASRAAFLGACMMFGIPCDGHTTVDNSYDVPAQPIGTDEPSDDDTSRGSPGLDSMNNPVMTRDGRIR